MSQAARLSEKARPPHYLRPKTVLDKTPTARGRELGKQVGIGIVAVEEARCKFLQLGERAFGCADAPRSQMGTNSSDAHDHVLKCVRGQIRWVDAISQLNGVMIPPEAARCLEGRWEIRPEKFA